MKKFLFIVCLLTTTAAFAGTTPPTATSAPAANAAPGQNAPNFADVKARALERISKHLEEAQKRQTCIQAANDKEAFKACFPNRGKFGGGRFGHGGPGGDEGGGPDVQ
jgi:hypothetical protein